MSHKPQRWGLFFLIQRSSWDLVLYLLLCLHGKFPTKLFLYRFIVNLLPTWKIGAKNHSINLAVDRISSVCGGPDCHVPWLLKSVWVWTLVTYCKCMGPVVCHPGRKKRRNGEPLSCSQTGDLSASTRGRDDAFLREATPPATAQGPWGTRALMQTPGGLDLTLHAEKCWTKGQRSLPVFHKYSFTYISYFRGLGLQNQSNRLQKKVPQLKQPR